MKKRESQLGTLVQTCTSLEDFMEQMESDASIVGKEVGKLLEAFNLRNPYDREVMMLMIMNVAAAVTSAVEEYNDGIEEWMDHLYHFHLDCYREMKKKEIEEGK